MQNSKRLTHLLLWLLPFISYAAKPTNIPTPPSLTNNTIAAPAAAVQPRERPLSQLPDWRGFPINPPTPSLSNIKSEWGPHRAFPQNNTFYLRP